MANEQNTTEARLKALEVQNAKLMAALEAKIESTATGLDAGQLERILTKVAETAAAPSNVLASKLKPENADHLHVSVFEHPEGGLAKPKPALVRELVFMGRARESELTYAEVLAVNALNATLQRSERRLCRDGKWKATVSDDNTRLTISVPVKTIDDRQDLPSFLAIVEELTSGEKPKDQAYLLNELALLKAQMAELTSSHA